MSTSPTDQLLRQLPAHHRDILVATYFHRRTTREAARRLGLPHDTVKTQLYQAMRHLTGLLATVDATEGVASRRLGWHRGPTALGVRVRRSER